MKLPINNDIIASICRQEDIAYLGLFGSYARGDAKDTSDVDILVDFTTTKSFFQLSKVQQKLEGYFHKKVDLVLRTAIKENIKPYIYHDLQILYEERWSDLYSRHS